MALLGDTQILRVSNGEQNRAQRSEQDDQSDAQDKSHNQVSLSGRRVSSTIFTDEANEVPRAQRCPLLERRAFR